MKSALPLLVLVVLGALLAFTSTTNAATDNLFQTGAGIRMVVVDFLGRLQSSTVLSRFVFLLVLILGATALAIIGRRLQSPGGSNDRGLPVRLAVVAGLAMLALYTVIAPLKFSSYRSPIHKLSLTLHQHIQPGETIFVALPRKTVPDTIATWYLGPFETRRADRRSIDRSRLSSALVLGSRSSVESLLAEIQSETRLTQELLEEEGKLVVVRVTD